MLDLSLQSFEFGNDLIKQQMIESFSKNWFCDWFIINSIKDISLICDANMYRIYAAQFGKDTDVSDAQAIKLASLMTKPINLYIINNIREQLYSTLDRMLQCSRKSEYQSLFRIPMQSKAPFNNLISLYKNTSSSQITPVFQELYQSLIQANKKKDTFISDTSNIYELISKEKFEIFYIFAREFIDKAFDLGEKNEFDPSSLKTKIDIAITLVKCLMLFCVPNNFVSDDFEISVYEKNIKPDAMDAFSDKLIYLNQMKSFTMCQAFCVTIQKFDKIKLQSNDLPDTDAFKLLITRLYKRYINRK